MRRAFVLLMLILTTAGCTGPWYNLPKVDLPAGEYEVLGESEGVATGIHLFQVIPIQLNDKLGRAVNQAIAKRGGDAVVDVQVQESWFWAYVLNGYRTKVRGNVVKRR